MSKIEEISGEYMDCHYSKVHRLNIELAVDEIGTPILIFEDATKQGKERELFRLHIKEAINLKSIIDNSIIDWNWYKVDETRQKAMDEIKRLMVRLIKDDKHK
jgi:hypothetical protein